MKNEITALYLFIQKLKENKDAKETLKAVLKVMDSMIEDDRLYIQAWEREIYNA